MCVNPLQSLFLSTLQFRQLFFPGKGWASPWRKEECFPPAREAEAAEVVPASASSRRSSSPLWACLEVGVWHVDPTGTHSLGPPLELHPGGTAHRAAETDSRKQFPLFTPKWTLKLLLVAYCTTKGTELYWNEDLNWNSIAKIREFSKSARLEIHHLHAKSISSTSQ